MRLKIYHKLLCILERILPTMAAISTLMFTDNVLRKDGHDDERTPTTPRAGQRPTFSMSLQEPTGPSTTEASSHNAPQYQSSTHPPSIGPSQSSGATSMAAQEEVRENDDDDENAMDVDPTKDDSEGLDDDTEQGETGSTSRKKKGQRFFCTGYPPCNLSFTRSEHLARHIRKHTGERPFQCHCNRRFSRLDNLRQHAQTVHVNEEIPTDSLAATGTRFQRQIRTDRVRPAGRPRTNTMSSTGSHSRGHSRNLSTSSIGSIASTTSNYSTTDPRRRPPPLLMATENTGRPKLGIDPPNTPPQQFASYATNSPGDLNTPTSTAFSVTPSSPSFGSTIGSPISSASRIGAFFGSSRAPGRRLSVPTGPPPYQSQYGSPYNGSYGSSAGPASSMMSSNSSAIASPTTSTFSFSPGFHVPPGEDWRRRTWHPSTYSNVNFNYARPATSGLTYSQTPDAPQPAFAQNAIAAAGQAPRLPGIESFDHVQQRPTTPPRRNASPGHPDPTNPPSLLPPADLDGQNRYPQHNSPSRSHHYPEFDDHGRTSTSWVQETIEQIHQVQSTSSKRENQPSRNVMGPPSATYPPSHHPAQEASQLQSVNNRTKRNGWYSGPGPAVRTSPEDSSSSDGVPTPGTSVADMQPAIMHSNGMIEAQHQMLSADAHQNVSADSDR